MSKKRELILGSAMRCFATKGYHATSIQEIAEEAGIAKGLVYFYFKSKEELLLSGLRHHYEKQEQVLLELQQSGGMSPKELLHATIQYMFEHSREGREFLTMMITEQSGKASEQLAAFLIEVRLRGLQGLLTSIVAIYGEPIRPYALDAASVIQALITDFMLFIVFAPEAVEAESLAAFIMARLDEITTGMVDKGAAPLLDERTMMDSMSQLQSRISGSGAMDRQNALKLIRLQIDQSDLPDAQREETLESLAVIESELAKDESSRVVLKGMIALLRNCGIAELAKSVDVLEQSIAK